MVTSSPDFSYTPNRENCNSPASLWRLAQHPDEIIVVFDNSPINRWSLSVSLSKDGGANWTKTRDIAAPDGLVVSYPNITQTSELRSGAPTTET